MLNIRTALLSVAFLALFTFTIGLMGVRTGVVPGPSSEQTSVLDNQKRPANNNIVNNTGSYRPRLDECFDVSLTELASCRTASQTPDQSYRPPLDVCFDVSLTELASCRTASQTPDQSYRSPLDECFDVSLTELASCRTASQTPVQSYRSPLDACFDVSLTELASCRNASYEEFQPPSIYGDGFPYPDESIKPYAENADPDRDVSPIQNQAQTLLVSFLVDNCLGMQPRLLAICQNAVQAQDEIEPATTLVDAVRQSTERFKNVDKAQAAGYGLFHGCVSGPQEGAMGVHFVNGDLVGDGALDPTRPEALLYEFKNGRMQLSGVEYVVIAEAWHANNEAPPVLMGQLLNYVGSPNRYGIPAFYELHVWAWNSNPLGTFADWNPMVSCDSYTAEDAPHGASH